MDLLALAEVAKTGLTLATPVLQSVTATLLATVFLRGSKRNEEAEKEFEKLKAGKIGEVINGLLESGRMTYLEFYKCNNFLKIAKLADEMAKESGSNNTAGREFDFDWFMRFFEAAGNISNDDLRTLWGKILDGETQKPKSCSLRTLDVLKNISQEEAFIFQKIIELVVHSGDCHFIDGHGFNGFSLQKLQDKNPIKNHYNFTYYDHIRPMIECGLLTEDLGIALDCADESEIYNDKIYATMTVSEKNRKRDPYGFAAYHLTSAGVQLYKILRSCSDFKCNDEYIILCLQQLMHEYKYINVKAYRVVNINDETKEISHEKTNLLS